MNLSCLGRTACINPYKLRNTLLRVEADVFMNDFVRTRTRDQKPEASLKLSQKHLPRLHSVKAENSLKTKYDWHIWFQHWYEGLSLGLPRCSSQGWNASWGYKIALCWPPAGSCRLNMSQVQTLHVGSLCRASSVSRQQEQSSPCLALIMSF